MLSLIVGFVIGSLVSRSIVGLLLVVTYGVVAGVMSANVSHGDGAGLWPIILASVGFGLARLLIVTRHALKATSERRRSKHLRNNDVSYCSEPGPRISQSKDDGSDREDLYVSAGLAHAAFLNALGRELNDIEFVASALGAFDGTVQALGRKLSQVDMLAMGSAFALRQINDLQRVQYASPGAKGDLIGRAMTSEPLEELRAQSGHLAFTLTKNPPLTGSVVH